LHATIFLQRVYVDGELVGRNIDHSYAPQPGFLAYDFQTGPTPPGSSRGSVNSKAQNEYKVDPSQTDFYAFNQSMTMTLVNDKTEDDSWYAGVPMLSRKLAQLKPGNHKVRVELYYWIRGQTDEIDRWKRYGWLKAGNDTIHDFTLVSQPLCAGEFNFHVPDDVKVSDLIVADPMPKRATKIPDDVCDQFEKTIVDVMSKRTDWGARNPETEVIMCARITGNWEFAGIAHLEDCPEINCRCRKFYGLPYEVACYRSPLNGWKKEMPVAIFKLSASSFKAGTLPDDFGISVVMGGNREVDIDSVPDSYWTNIRRCPPELRNGLV